MLAPTFWLKQSYTGLILTTPWLFPMDTVSCEAPPVRAMFSPRPREVEMSGPITAHCCLQAFLLPSFPALLRYKLLENTPTAQPFCSFHTSHITSLLLLCRLSSSRGVLTATHAKRSTSELLSAWPALLCAPHISASHHQSQSLEHVTNGCATS